MVKIFLTSIFLLVATTATANPHVTKESKPIDAPYQDKIKDTIRNNLNKIRHCYELQLLKMPSLDGEVLVKFEISSQGTVLKSKVTTPMLGSKAFENCIINATLTYRFPKPRELPVIVGYNFVFQSENDPKKINLDKQARLDRSIDEYEKATFRVKTVPLCSLGKKKVSIGSSNERDLFEELWYLGLDQYNLQKCQGIGGRKTNGRHNGTLYLDFRIGSDGSVDDLCQIEQNTIPDKTALACALSDIQNWLFAPRSAPKRIQYGFIFSNEAKYWSDKSRRPPIKQLPHVWVSWPPPIP